MRSKCNGKIGGDCYDETAQNPQIYPKENSSERVVMPKAEVPSSNCTSTPSIGNVQSWLTQVLATCEEQSPANC